MKEKINVLGTEYTIKGLDKKDGYMQGREAVGYSDTTNKEIYYLKGFEERETVIHELLHAMFHEAGVPFGVGIHTEENVLFLEKKIDKIVDYFLEEK